MTPFWEIFLAFILGVAVGNIPMVVVAIACIKKVKEIDRNWPRG